MSSTNEGGDVGGGGLLIRDDNDGDVGTAAVAASVVVPPANALNPNNNINNNHIHDNILNLDNIVARFFNEVEDRQGFRTARLIRDIQDDEPTLPRFNPNPNSGNHNRNHRHHPMHNYRRLVNNNLAFDNYDSDDSFSDDNDDYHIDDQQDDDKPSSSESSSSGSDDSSDSDSEDEDSMTRGIKNEFPHMDKHGIAWVKEMRLRKYLVLKNNDGIFDLVGRGISDEDDYLRSTSVVNCEETDKKICDRLQQLIRETVCNKCNKSKLADHANNKNKSKKSNKREENGIEIITIKRFVIRDVIFTNRTADAVIETLQYFANSNSNVYNSAEEEEKQEAKEKGKSGQHHNEEEEEEEEEDKKLPPVVSPSSSKQIFPSKTDKDRKKDKKSSKKMKKKNNIVVVEFEELCLDNVRQNVEFQRVFKSALNLNLFTSIRIDQPHFAWTTDDDESSSSEDEDASVQPTVEQEEHHQQQIGRGHIDGDDDGGKEHNREEEAIAAGEGADKVIEEVDGDQEEQEDAGNEAVDIEEGGQNTNNAIIVIDDDENDDGESAVSDVPPDLEDSDDDSIPELIRPRHLRDETAFAIRDAMLSYETKSEASEPTSTTAPFAAAPTATSIETGMPNAPTRRLHSLIVSRVQLDEGSWDALGQGLARCTSLKELVFKNVRFGGRSEEAINRELGKFIRGIRQNESLERFTFQNARELVDAQLAKLIMSLPLHHIQYLNLNETPWNEQTIRLISNQILKLPNCKLNTLSLESPTTLRTGMTLFGMLLFPSANSSQSTSLSKPLLASLLDGISNNQSLHTLSLKNCGLDDEAYQMVMKSLSSNPNSSVEKLDLSSNWISDLELTPSTSSSSDGDDTKEGQGPQEQNQNPTVRIITDDANRSNKCRRLRKLNLSDNPVFGLTPFSLRFLKDKNPNFNRKEWLKRQKNHLIHLLKEFTGLGQLSGLQDVNNKDLYTPYIQHLLDVNKSGLHLMLHSSHDIPPLSLWTSVLARTTYEYNSTERRNRSKKRHADTIYNLLQGPVLAGRQSYY